jgi:hypothetical protein
MGFFSRDKPSAPPKVERPIVVQPSDLPGFSERLEAVVRVLYGANDAAIRGAVRALSESVGGSDPWSVGFEQGDSTRLWLWSAQACELANEQGEYGLAPHVFVLTFWWKPRQSKMTLNDFADMWLDPLPPDVDRAILKATSEALSHFTDDQPVAQTANEALTAGQLRNGVQAAIAS